MCLKPYTVYVGCPEEGAVLIFARNVQEARKIGYPYVSEWFDCEYIHVRANIIKENWKYYFSLADKDLLSKDIPHVAKEIPVCKDPECPFWATDFDGYCDDHRQEYSNDSSNSR